MLWLLLALAAQGERQPATTPPPVSPQVEVRLMEPEQELSDLLDSTAALLGFSIEYAKADVAGTVTLRLSGHVPPDEFLATVHRALAARGMTTVQTPGSKALTVVKLADAAALARLEDGPSVTTRAGFAKLLVELQRERVEAATDAVKLVLSKSGSVTAFKDAKRLLVADLAPHVLQAQRVALAIDGAYDERAVIEIPLQRTSPTGLTALIDRIGQAEKLVFGEKLRGTMLAHPEGRSVLIVAPVIELDRWRGLIDQFDRAEPAITRNYWSRRFALGDIARLLEDSVHAGVPSDANEPWRVATDQLSGTLMVTATPARHDEIAKLFERLEGVASEVQRPLRSFPVKYRSARELRDPLQGLLEAGALKGAPAGEPEQAAAPTAPLQGATGLLAKQPSPPPPPVKTDALGEQVVLTVDEPTNRLLVLAPPRLLEQIEALLKELDVRAPQVLVEALVLSLTEKERRELGVEFGKLRVDGNTQARLSSVFGLGLPDPSATVLPGQATNGGLAGVALSPGDWSTLVHALETIDNGRTLTVPKILVDNNRVATLHSVLQTPFASTNASTTVATTSFGGTQDAGTQIDVTPQITEGDQLQLDFTVSISAFVGTSTNPALPPPRQESKLKSVATVPDGFTVAVGGLSIEAEGTARTQVPWLGSIPLLGVLFGSRSVDETRSRFYVFLRASVMRSPSFEDLKYASSREVAAAGLDDGWPKLEPRVIR